MTALTSKSNISGSPSRATANAGFGALWDFISERLNGGGASDAELAATRTSLKAARDLQPISASVAGNALTLTLNPTNLDFRSSTLGSGTINTRTVAAAISLVISSGSTLGTTNGALARLAVLALDNAGTVELAVVNLAGGVNLDESGVISTTAEGGAGAADSASTIYSANARSNVPYRIVGFVETTQTTAGTWASAPSVVNGSSSPLAMWLGGYGQSWQVVTGSRVNGTTYTNTTGRPIQVLVTVAGANTSGQCASAFQINGTAVMSTTTSASNGSSWGPIAQNFSAIVPPGATYRIVDTALSNSMSLWSEWR